MGAEKLISNPLGLAVLGVLLVRPMHPYDIASTLREWHKHESIKIRYGSLYTVVDKLHSLGFIEPIEKEREGNRPERTVYAITSAGKNYFYSWLEDLLANPVKEYTQLGAGLSFIATLSPERALGLIAKRIDRLRDIVQAMKTQEKVLRKQGLERLFILELEYEIALKEAELNWLEGIYKDIKEGKLEGIEPWRSWHRQSLIHDREGK